MRVCFCHVCRRATINRYGFNSAGADAAASHLDNFWVHAQRNPDIKPGAATTASSGSHKVPVSCAQTVQHTAAEALM
jgi:dihydroorotate dehydrogenase